MIMEHWWNDRDRENRRNRRENRPGANCQPHIIHGIAWDRAPAFAVRGRRLSHVTA